MSKREIGFVGLGLMGSQFTRRLVEQGFNVHGYDRIPEKITAATSHGVKSTSSTGDVSKVADQIHVCVMTPADLEDALFGRNGIASHGTKSKVLVDHSTTPLEVTREFASRLKDQTNMEWIDAPVSGGPDAAREGTLSIMAGGNKAAMDHALPVLQTLGDCTHMGEIGSGQTTKMVNQILVLNNYCILAEALALAEAGGVDPSKIPGALAKGHAGSNLLQRLFPRMIDRDYKPAGYAFQVLKDLHMVDSLAKSLGVTTPMSSQATALFQALNDQGHGELDGIAVLKLYEN